MDATAPAIVETLLPALGTRAGSGCFSDFTTEVEADSESDQDGDDEDSGHKAIGPLLIRSLGGGPYPKDRPCWARKKTSDRDSCAPLGA